MKCLRDKSFPKCLRLRKKTDYKNVYTKGSRYYTRDFIIFVCKNNFKYPRIGITATRKFGKAVKRNRIKRLIREFFRLNKPLFQNGYDYVIVVKNNCNLVFYTEVASQLEHFLKNEKNNNISN